MNEELNDKPIKVLKRKGILEDLDMSKLTNMAIFVTKDTNCDPLILVEKLTHSLRDGISTEFLHKQMTFEAVNLIHPSRPQWRLVAGRCLMVELIKEKNISVSKLIGNDDFKIDNCKFTDFLQLMGASYNQSWFIHFQAEYLNNLAVKTIKFERNFDFFIESVITNEKKFLISYETPQHLYFVIALIYAQTYFSIRKLKINDNLDKFEILTQTYYELISKKKVSFPSVILSELRKPNANLASCFIGQFKDDMEEIMALIKDFARISKAGGGIGANLDHIRAFKSWLMGVKGNATGVKPLMKVLNDLMLYVNQSGIKDGAMTVSISGWHMDVLDFLKTQQFGGEEREKSMDLFLQLVFNDALMEAMENDTEWYLFDPYETKKKYGIFLSDYIGEEFTEKYKFLIEETKTGGIELFTVIRARELFKEMLKTLLARGTPYVAFKDNINRVNNMKKDKGLIYGVNLCCESFSVFDTDTTHCCNLLSLVAPFIEKEELEFVIHHAMNLLDLTIYLSQAPTKGSKKHNDEINAVGLGVMGLADWAAANQMSYETELGRRKANALFERISYFAINASSDLATELGSFKRFNDSKWSDGDLLGRPIQEILDRHDAELNSDLDWSFLSNKVKTKGIRNGWLLAVAPNTTSSSGIGVTASILPTYSKAFTEETKCGNVMRMPLYIEEFPLGYKEYKYIDMIKMNSFIATVQFWIDAGISYEPMFDLNDDSKRSTQYIFEVYLDAWKKGVKTIYYVRWIKPGTESLSEKKECIGCAG